MAGVLKANVLGVHIDPVRIEDVLARIEAAISSGDRAIILHTHVRGVNIAYEQEWFRQFLNSADLLTCDGMGIKLGARLLGYRIPQRFTLADWMWQLADFAEARQYSLFFLGNPPGTPELAAARLQERFPDLRIVGAHHGFFDQRQDHPENEFVVQQINAVRPNILLAGLGMPNQERWLLENWPRVDANVAMSCGGLFEYLAGEHRRGPHWMTEHYLEWLARLIIAPRRYAWRYLRDNPLFLYRLLKQLFSGKTSVS